MLLSKYVPMKWNSKNKKHYEDLGYTYTRMRDSFDVDVKHLPKSSQAIVKVKCDYCNKEYEKTWHRYLIENQGGNIHKDCCKKCSSRKVKEYVMQKYGKGCVLEVPEIKAKIASTNMKIYGCENPFSSDKIKDKIRETNLEKYGYTNPMKNPDILAKASNTCMQRYNVKWYCETQVYRGADSPRWKGGLAVQRDARLTYSYRKWRTDIFQKNHYICQCCGDKNGLGHQVKLNAHHILNWKDNPDKRYDIDNGITLCEHCHNHFHSLYGKSNNTQAQLDLFLQKYGKKIS